jgi:hypothetical protein
MNREMGVPYEARVSRPPTRLPAGQQIPAVAPRPPVDDRAAPSDYMSPGAAIAQGRLWLLSR